MESLPVLPRPPLAPAALLACLLALVGCQLPSGPAAGDGRWAIADFLKGLLAWDPASGHIHTLIDRVTTEKADCASDLTRGEDASSPDEENTTFPGI